MPNHDAKRPSQELGSLALVVVLILLAGALCYFFAEVLEKHIHEQELKFVTQIQSSAETAPTIALKLDGELQAIQQEQHWVVFFRHMSIAFLISLIIILTVELRTRRLTRAEHDRHLEEVKQNVWNAIGKRLLGERIATELEAIMKETAAKQECVYSITFRKPDNELANDRDHIILEVINRFKLRSLSDERKRDRIYPFKSSVAGYQQLGNLPRYTLFSNGKDETEINPTTDKDNKSLLARNIDLPTTPEGRVEVAVGMEMVYKLHDSEVFITEVPIEGLTIVVKNLAFDIIGGIEIDMIHRCDELERPAEGFWVFPRAILPGQGFYINWKEATKQLPPAKQPDGQIPA